MSQGEAVFAGRYAIERPIARGGMADVYLGHDRVLDRAVAIKVLFQEFARDPSFVERFRREAQNAGSLTHPHIVSVYDWGQEHGTYFIVMEYVEGRSLREILRAQGRIPPLQAAGIAAEIADALAFAHRHGVVHRDIKPGNVLITPQGQVKVTDFGIAANPTNAASGLTQTGAVMGTATYFSPEQAQGFAVDGRTDVYALGIVLYEMVTGEAPFQAESPVAVAMKHVRELPTPPSNLVPDLPMDLERIILAAMAKSVNARYQSAEAMREDLIRFERGRPVTAAYSPFGDVTAAAPAGDPTQMWQPKKRRWGGIIAVAAGLGILAAALIVLLVPALRDQVLGTSTSSGPRIEVPDVTTGNPAFAAARALLVSKGFKVKRVDVVANGLEPGRVVKQSPPAGQLLSKGQTVKLNVANNMVLLPSFVGQTIQQATATLQGLGLVAAPVDMASDQPPGTVLSMSPVSGTTVARGSTVTLTIAKAPTVAVPAVMGQDQVAASQTIQAAGLQPQIVPQSSTTVPAGKVINTSPVAGTMVAKGSAVMLLVSTGPQTVTVPSVIGQPRDSAIAALTGMGLSVSATCSSNSPVVSQNPPGGSMVQPGSQVAISCVM
jgi:eukaryotic-like serine/threonine-protein kinase